MSVVDLADGLPISRPAVSQHLRILKDAQLVRVKPVGTRRYYELDIRGLASLRSYFDGFWTEVLEAFKARVEEK
ncbi:DNA-binding transcriptional ArsR family regulator [Tunturiibacter psychrotolerans]